MDISQDLRSHFNSLRKWTTPDGINFYTFNDYKTYMVQSLSNSIVQIEKQHRKSHIRELVMCIEKLEQEKKIPTHPDVLEVYNIQISKIQNKISELEDGLKNDVDLIMEIL